MLGIGCLAFGIWVVGSIWLMCDCGYWMLDIGY